MPDNAPVSEEAALDAEFAHVIDNGILADPTSQASQQSAEPAPAADTGTEQAAAPPEEAKPAEEAPKGDAKATEATDQQQAGQKPEGEPSQAAQPSAPQQTKEEREAAAAKAWQDRQRTRQAVANKVDEVYGPKSEDQLVAEGLKPEDARLQAIREEMVFNQQRTRIAELNAGMQVEAVNVTNDFPVFNPKSPDYDEAFAQEVQQAYTTAARVQTDENGIVLNAELPLYDFYQRMANIYNRGTSKGAQQGQADMAEMMSRTEPIGGSSSTVTKGPESLDEMEDRLGNVAII